MLFSTQNLEENSDQMANELINQGGGPKGKSQAHQKAIEQMHGNDRYPTNIIKMLKEARFLSITRLKTGYKSEDKTRTT